MTDNPASRVHSHFMEANRFWSLEECCWVESPSVAVPVPTQREDETVPEAVDA